MELPDYGRIFIFIFQRREKKNTCVSSVFNVPRKEITIYYRLELLEFYFFKAIILYKLMTHDKIIFFPYYIFCILISLYAIKKIA